jgi:hypothetical protein
LVGVNVQVVAVDERQANREVDGVGLGHGPHSRWMSRAWLRLASAHAIAADPRWIVCIVFAPRGVKGTIRSALRGQSARDVFAYSRCHVVSEGR